MNISVKEVQGKSFARMSMLLKKLAEQVDDLRPVWRNYIVKYQKEISPGIFATRGKVLGTRWATYSKAYLEWKQKNYPGQQMLILKGDMYNATTGGSGWRQSLTKSTMSIGIKGRPYYPVHQFGSSKRNIPARPYFLSNEYSPRALKIMIELTRDYINERIKKNDK